MSDTLSENYSKLNKRYQEIKNKLADIETKLAESEKQIKDAREAGNMAVDSWCKNRRKYEAQIAEMQNKSFILYSMLYETLEKQGCDNVASQIDQMTGWTYDKEADWLKGNRNYDQLKQQLAEKEKAIENWQTIYESVVQTCHNDKEEIERLNKQLAEKEKEISEVLAKQSITCLNTIEKAYQDKISFCIEQLNKVKEHNDNLVCDDEDYYNYITAFIDNQINELKGKVE